MRLADHLARLSSGKRPDGDWLLGTAALTTASGDVYGEEAIVAAFRRIPMFFGGIVLRTPTGVARFGTEGAVIADVYDGRIACLWRVGGESVTSDLAQPRGDLVVDTNAVDLDAAELGRLTILLTSLIRDPDGDGAFRRRGFVIRAFADDRALVALVAVYTAEATGIDFQYLAVVLTDDGTTIVADRPARGPWTPRL